VILYSNARFAIMAKADLTTVMGSNLLTYFMESDRAAIGDLLKNATTGERQIRAGLRAADGRVLPVNVAIHLRDRDDPPYTIISIISDLTEILAAQASTMTALRYARHLIEAILDPLITIDAHGKITDVNRASERITGRSHAELIGTAFTDYFTEPDKARSFYEDVYNKGFMLDVPLSVRNHSGTVTAMLCNASLYRQDDGTVGGVVAVGRDITLHYADRIPAKQRSIGWIIAKWPGFGVAWVGVLLLTSNVLSTVDIWSKRQLVVPVSLEEGPYLHTGDHRPTRVFHAGETAFAHVTTQRNVACFGLIHQRILSLTDGDIFNRVVWNDPEVSFGYTDAGKFETDYRLVIPDYLPPGDYFVERNNTYTCGDTTIHQTIPLIPFSVTN
jgi:PAS domain S-box-containing protein